MCCLRNIAMRDYQESVTTGQTDRQTEGQTDRQRHARQSDPYICFHICAVMLHMRQKSE